MAIAWPWPLRTREAARADRPPADWLGGRAGRALLLAVAAAAVIWSAGRLSATRDGRTEAAFLALVAVTVLAPTVFLAAGLKRPGGQSMALAASGFIALVACFLPPGSLRAAALLALLAMAFGVCVCWRWLDRSARLGGAEVFAVLLGLQALARSDIWLGVLSQRAVVSLGPLAVTFLLLPAIAALGTRALGRQWGSFVMALIPCLVVVVAGSVTTTTAAVLGLLGLVATPATTVRGRLGRVAAGGLLLGLSLGSAPFVALPSLVARLSRRWAAVGLVGAGLVLLWYEPRPWSEVPQFLAPLLLTVPLVVLHPSRRWPAVLATASVVGLLVGRTAPSAEVLLAPVLCLMLGLPGRPQVRTPALREGVLAASFGALALGCLVASAYPWFRPAHGADALELLVATKRSLSQPPVEERLVWPPQSLSLSEPRVRLDIEPPVVVGAWLVDTFLGHSEAVAPGQAVATVVATSTRGQSESWVLRQGVETDDWAARRLARRRAMPWLSWVSAEEGLFGSRYRSRLTGSLADPTVRVDFVRADTLAEDVTVHVFFLGSQERAP